MSPLRILIVEDDADHGRSLLEAIGDLGFAAELAPTGTAGVEAFRARGADVVLSDLVLPDLDGIELLSMHAHGFLGKGEIEIALHRAEHQRLSCCLPLKVCQVG